MENKDFAVFILTHGRPDNVITYKTLQKCGYTGRTYFIVDNEDKDAERYIQNFGAENVRIFDKKFYADRVDEGDNFDERRTTTHARNACFDIAEALGITYFVELDDDYTSFDYRVIINGNAGRVPPVKNLDKVFSWLLDYYKSHDFLSIAIAQGGDFIGGIDNGKGVYRFSKRKCMNSFLCSTERRFSFIGSMNEDVNAYTVLGNRGGLFLTIPFLSLTQKGTQTQKGAITDKYLLFGTYCKSFMTVMMHPSGVKVSMMMANNVRLHHSISWINTTPMIIDERWKRSETKQEG